MKKNLKSIINRLLSPVHLRVVSSNWGPRGYIATVKKLKSLGFSPNVVYDVGASDGSWSLELLKLFPDAIYYLFEPLPECKQKLEILAADYKNINYQNCALGSQLDVSKINQHHGQSSLLNNNQWAAEKIDVNVNTVDNVINSGCCPRPDFIKADIQGYELEMLKGAENTLNSCHYILLEISWFQIYENGPFAGEVLGFLEDKGFHVFDICTYSMRPLDGRLTQSDVLLVNKKTGLFDEKKRF